MTLRCVIPIAHARLCRIIVWRIGWMMWMIVAVIVWIIACIIAIAPVIRVVAHIPIPVVPRVVRIAPHSAVVWRRVTTPAIYPRRRVDTKGHIRSTPSTKHRCHILRLHPYLISREHNVVEGWIVCRGITHSLACSKAVVARWQTICWRVKAIETARIGTLVVVSHDR